MMYPLCGWTLVKGNPQGQTAPDNYQYCRFTRHVKAVEGAKGSGAQGPSEDPNPLGPLAPWPLGPYHKAMFTVRRHDLAPRVEMTPLIDVIFLLLTFFIYSLVMMVRAELLPVTLTTLSTGEQAQAAEVVAITIDRAGQLYLNRQPVTADQLDEQLKEMVALDQPPKLFIAMEADDKTTQTPVDRGPLLIGLIEQVRNNGITDFNIVGEPAEH